MGMIGLVVTARASMRMDVDMDIAPFMVMGVGVDAIADDAPDDVEA